MKKIAFKTLLKTAVILTSIALLIACGGSKTEKETALEAYNSGLPANSTEATETSDNTHIPALSLTALDNAPTIDVSQAQLDAPDSNAIVSTNDTSSSFDQKSNLSMTFAEPVLGFIVKYKNPNNSSNKILGGINKVTAQSSTLTGASQILPSGMSVGMASVASKNNIRISLKADRYDASKMFSLETGIDHQLANKIAQDMQAADPNIEYVALNKIKQPSYTPNDVYFTDKNLPALRDASPFGVKAETAWNTSSGAGVVVAVLDTGYRPHADMASKILPGYDFISIPFSANDSTNISKTPDLATRDNNALDTGDGVNANDCSISGEYTPAQNSTWHGTHVAGIIAANANNKIGIAGLSYGAKILPVRVLGKCGGLDSDIIDGIVWAAGGTIPGIAKNPYPAKVINLSLGGYDSDGICSAPYQDAIATARDLGAVVVVAAGNGVYSVLEGKNIGVNAINTSPANCADAITVGATTTSGEKAIFSNFGSIVDISAPGVSILSTVNSGSLVPASDTAYASKSGTSMATPLVSAAIALMLSANPHISGKQAEQFIKQSVNSFATGGCISLGGCGIGIVDASKVGFVFAGGHARSDFDGNAKSDLIYKKSFLGYDEIYLGYINGTSQTITKSFNTVNSKSIVAIGDFNGDRRTDILEASTATGKLFNFIYMNGTKISSIKTITGLQPSSSKIFAAADLNFDGKADLLLRNSVGDLIVALMPSSGSTALVYKTVANVPNGFVYKGVGDTDGDGKLEVIWQNSYTFELKIITLDGDTALTIESGYAGGTLSSSYEIEGVGHFLSKTKDSILVRGNPTNAFDIIHNRVGGNFDLGAQLKNSKNIHFVLPSGYEIAGFGDYDGNGIDDVLFRQTYSTKAFVLNINNGLYTSVTLPALSPTLVAQGKQ